MTILLVVMRVFPFSVGVIRNDGVNRNDDIFINNGIDYSFKSITKSTIDKKHALQVSFQNLSGKEVELYWASKDGPSFRGSLSNEHVIVMMRTFLGHRFYFTPKGSNGTRDKILHEISIMEHTGFVTLFDADTMKKREHELRRYYGSMGRRWMNRYYFKEFADIFEASYTPKMVLKHLGSDKHYTEYKL